MRVLLAMLLVCCGCAMQSASDLQSEAGLPTTSRQHFGRTALALPPLPPEMDRQVTTADVSQAQTVFATPPLLALEWEHDLVNCSGFVIERTTDLVHFTVVGYLPATNINSVAKTFTFNWPIVADQDRTFYRVGALP